MVDVGLGEADLQLGKLDLNAELELLQEEGAHCGLVERGEHWALFELHVFRLREELGGMRAQFLQFILE